MIAEDGKEKLSAKDHIFYIIIFVCYYGEILVAHCPNIQVPQQFNTIRNRMCSRTKVLLSNQTSQIYRECTTALGNAIRRISISARNRGGGAKNGRMNIN